MSIDEIKKAVNMARGAQVKDSKPDKPVVQHPEAPKPAPDKSVFQGKPYIKRDDLRWQLRDQKYYKPMGNIDQKRREEIADKLLGKKDFIKPSDIKKARDEITKGKWGKYGDIPDAEKRTINKFLDSIEGK